jgi:hypothetical protein
MDKTFFEELATRHNVSTDITKQIYLDICKEMARRLASNEKQSNPYFTVKPVNRAEKSKLSSDGSRRTIEARFFGRMILKGIAAAKDKQAGG